VTRKVEPEVLAGFLEEARGYLPGIRAGIASGPDHIEPLQESARLAHTIKGTAALVGLVELSHLAARLEEALDEIVEARSPLGDEKAGELAEAVEQIERAIESVAPAADDVPAELREVFRLEAEDHLRAIAAVLPEVERDPSNKGALQQVRRSAHTLKGSAGMAGFHAVTRLAHRMEDLLDRLYEDEQSVTPDVIRLLFASADVLEALAAGEDCQASLANVYAQYDALLPAVAAAEPVRPVERASEAVAPPRQEMFVRVPIARLDNLVKLVSELVVTRSALEQRLGELERQVGELRLSAERVRQVAHTLETQYEARALGQRLGLLAYRQTADGFDDLELDRYTEFHLLSRALAETTTDIQTVSGELGHLVGALDGHLDRQAGITGEIEDKLMRLRMVPLSTLSARLQRTVRTVAQQCGKEVELVVEGEWTELDKTMLGEMEGPLLHLLRNAVDHGIEAPEVRAARGKPAIGTITLRAWHEGSHVLLQVSDDGSGLDVEAVRAVAVQRGLLDEKEANGLSEEGLAELVFLPGLSTASEVSEVSGRGVGLDVVMTQAHKLKGTVRVEPRPGEGASFTIRLPMTLALTRALLVRAQQETFAIPLDAVRLIVRFEEGMAEQVGEEPVVRIGERVCPLLSLGAVLGLPQAVPAGERPPLVVLHTGAGEVAVAVDELLGAREIVVKNLGNHLRRVPGVAGATLMGDGSVVLILNPFDLAGKGLSPAEVRARPAAPALTVLVVDDSPSVRRVVSSLLAKAGWRALTARDGLEALEVLHQSAPDAIVLDVEMPRMDGYELLATLRQHETHRNVPVIMATSRAGEKHRRKALELGATGYLVKPYADEALLDAVRQAVRRTGGSPVPPALDNAFTPGDEGRTGEPPVLRRRRDP
jgi:chemosensory pili system protein ChpA (sensor histidine kinase/response regulator)